MILLYAASPEAQRRNSLEKQLEKLDNDMSSLSKISALADTLTIGHVVNIYCWCTFSVQIMFKTKKTNIIIFHCHCLNAQAMEKPGKSWKLIYKNSFSRPELSVVDKVLQMSMHRAVNKGQ